MNWLLPSASSPLRLSPLRLSPELSSLTLLTETDPWTLLVEQVCVIFFCCRF